MPAAEEPRHVRDGRVARGLRHGVGEGRFDLAQLRVGLHHRDIQSFDHRHGLDVPQSANDVLGGEGPEAGDVQQANLDAAIVANPVDRRFRGFHHAAGADDGVLGVVQTVGHNGRVMAAGQLAEFFHHGLQRRQHLIVVAPLGDLALHVAVLVLDNPRHQRDLRIHQVAQARGRADEHLHHVGLGQPHVLDGVGGEEPVLHVEVGRLGVFGYTARD